MTYWNHRVVRVIGTDQESYMLLAEVFYDDDGDKKPHSFATPSLYGEDKKELEWVLKKLTECFSKPVVVFQHVVDRDGNNNHYFVEEVENG